MTKTWIMPPAERTIRPPADGWKAQAYYSVRVAFGRNNPIHSAIFYTGFLDGAGRPCGYNCAFNPMWGGEQPRLEKLHFLEVVALLPHEDES